VTPPSRFEPTGDQFERLLADYRYLHAHPELSLHEFETAAWLERRLEALGFTTQRIAETGVAAVLTNGDGPVVAFRADTDGLPVSEDTGVEWASRTVWEDADGNRTPVMHACGHDIHMTCAIAAAEWLASHKDEWSGTLELILQPAEEIVQGARNMLNAGLWDAIPHAEAVYGQHVWPIPAGQVWVNPGPFFAAVDTYRIEVFGRGGHGSMPETTIDPVVLTAAITLRLQTIVSREVGLHERAVLTVGSIHAGSKENVIPSSGELLVSTRTYSPDVQRRMAEAIARIARAEAAASGAPEPNIVPMYNASCVVNDADETATLLGLLGDELGEDAVLVPENPMTASEDFGYLGAAIGAPSVFWVFGGYRGMHPGDAVPTNHSPHFLPDPDSSIRTGTSAALTALMSRLGR